MAAEEHTDTQQGKDSTRLKLTDVERTAVGVAWLRWQGAVLHNKPGEPLLYDGSFDARLCEDLPPEVETFLRERETRSTVDASFGPHLMVVRTTSLDDALLRATGGPKQPTDPSALPYRQPKATSSLPVSNIRQVVILGAGLDTRAWRLPWPEGVTVFEVDTGTVEALKSRKLQGVPLRAAARHALVADLTDLPRLTSVLQGAGHKPDEPTVWVLEGLIGYLTKDAALALLRRVRELSASGSQLLVTAPPTQEQFDRFKEIGRQLYHAYVEPPQETVARAVAAGWTGAELVTKESLSELYGLQSRQPQIHALAS